MFRKNIPLLIILTGAILRMWFFWTPSFRGDEAGNMLKAVRVARGINDFIFFNNPYIALNNIILPVLQHNHPPLEFLVLVPSVPFQPREFSARLIYISISIIILVFSYFALKKIQGKRFALYFLAIYASSSYTVLLSQRVDYFLNMVAGTLVGIFILNFTKNPSKLSLRLLNFSYILGLLISIDYIFFIPAYFYLIYHYKNKIDKKVVLKEIVITICILSLFYLPYFLYSLLPGSPKNAGFNYYLSSYLNNNNLANNYLTFATNIKSSFAAVWEKYLRLPGVINIWPFSLLGVFYSIKKKKFLELTLLVLSVVLLEYPFISCCTAYINIYPILILLAVAWLLTLKNNGIYIILLIFIVNLLSTVLSFKTGIRPIGFNLVTTQDNIRDIAVIARKCLRENDTYISSEDPWRTQYYFTKPMLPDLESENITDNLAVTRFLQNELPYDISFVHLSNESVSKENIVRLEKISVNRVIIGSDKLYLMKECNK